MAREKDKSPRTYFCVDCQVDHSVDQFVIERKGKESWRRCLKVVTERVSGDTETVSKVLEALEDEYLHDYDFGVCKSHKCDSIDYLIDGRCIECHEKMEDKKNIVFKGDDKTKVFQSKEERYLHMVEFGENSEKNLALR